ncbi:glycosyl hydrolase family 8 [Arthrobacter sp. YN]|uniref:glycosyl hydrolase family 8 n=1 Tax=Arthrobacter sp. YN TaxID=2020486 RepID=UPI0018DF2AA3|nr:glycosyl hydrolase family 8 [Arthrobacter sp. YN]
MSSPAVATNNPAVDTAPATTDGTITAEQYPFPHNVEYPHGIMPSLDRDTLNRDMLSMYTKWRDQYITTVGAAPGEVRVRASDSLYKDGAPSEGVGFAMLLSVYMASSETGSRTDFDGLFRYYKRNLSPGYNFMGWKVDKEGNSIDPYAAPDGDFDASTALLMAHKQWGSSGAINYLDEAKKIIRDAMEHLIYKPSYLVKTSQTSSTAVISSYEIPAWFQLYKDITGEDRWDKATDAGYRMFDHFYNLNPTTGLVPFKWVLSSTGVPTYTGANGPDSNSTSYGFDPSRLPWRVAQDFLWNGTENSQLAHDLPDRNVKWFMSKINGNPDNALANYNVDGTDRATYTSPRNMTGPMAVAAMVDASNQESLDLLYGYLRKQEPMSDWPGGYYQDAVMMMSMLVLTGSMPNFYDSAPYPTSKMPAPLPATDTTAPTKPLNFKVTGTTLNTVNLSWAAAADDQGPVMYEIRRDGRLYNVTPTLNTKLEYLDPGTTYSITVTARDAAGNRTASEAVTGSTTVDTVAPAKTTGIVAQARSLSSITLKWNKPVDNDSINELSYDVYRNGGKVNAGPVYFPSDYKIENLPAGTPQSFTIVATDKSGNSSTSDVFTTSTTATDVTAPSRPSYLEGKRAADSVVLKWAGSTDDNPGSTVSYDVFTGDTQLNREPVTGTSFTVTNLQPQTEISLRVVAKDSAGNTRSSYLYDTSTKKLKVK